MQWFLQCIPESMAMAALALALAGHKLSLKTLAYIGLPLAAAVYVLRLLNLTFGIHTVFTVVALALLLQAIIKTNISRSFLYALIVQITLAVVETLMIGLIIFASGRTLEQLLSNDVVSIIIVYPQILALSMLALLISKPLAGRGLFRERRL